MGMVSKNRKFWHIYELTVNEMEKPFRSTRNYSKGCRHIDCPYGLGPIALGHPEGRASERIVDTPTVIAFPVVAVGGSMERMPHMNKHRF